MKSIARVQQEENARRKAASQCTAETLERIDGWVGYEKDGSLVFVAGATRESARLLMKEKGWTCCRSYMKVGEQYLIQV